ncbi:uncharacterized protein LOC130614588 isoform X1 [Hydractinia symbiolongicarpus]|uniref:uncharacterized protein LOC130614588 isoform X1 n=1 Tax=Hydractinia symbiolongicarpus TaxID=13093 RepID=UPI00254A59E8|nr:uncharacterized protein LOC130614588 isoform X1 [Hydractinia symbiolongicarpus]XP_057291998.1 uncharacterized protein LOC130614588 isoform X1 [Hydractinia symbiolongicarpus]
MKLLAASFIVVGVLAITVYRHLEILNNSFQYILDSLNIENRNNGQDTFKLPSINLTEAEENFNKVSQELVTAFRNVGFAYLIHVKDFDPDELLYWTKWFFDQPLKNKMRLAKNAFNKNNPNHFRGYFPLIAGGHSYKEAYELGVFEREVIDRSFPTPTEIINLTKTTNGRLYMRNIVEEKNVWPITEDEVMDAKFLKVMLKYRAFYIQTAKKVLHLLAVGFGFDKNAFDHLFGSSSLSTLRLIHYPTRVNDLSSIPKEAMDGDTPIVTGEHFDTAMVTILATFSNNGLQIKPKGITEWIDVPAIKDRLVVNIGALLSHMLDGRAVATNHRVIDIGTDRYSVPLFYEPCFDADLSKSFFGNKNVLVGNFTKYGPWMTNRTSMFAEYASTDFGLAD